MVRLVADLIGSIQHTAYGDIWDVIADPEYKEIAYTDAELQLHMDLTYYESPPGIQLLHCVRLDDCVTGGESMFVDAWHVAEMLRATYPDYFNTLTRVPATFQRVTFDREYTSYLRYVNQCDTLIHRRYGKQNVVNCALFVGRKTRAKCYLI